MIKCVFQEKNAFNHSLKFSSFHSWNPNLTSSQHLKFSKLTIGIVMENPFYYVCMHSGKNNHKINLEKKIIQVLCIRLKVVPKIIKVIPRMIKGSIYIIKKDST